VLWVCFARGKEICVVGSWRIFETVRDCSRETSLVGKWLVSIGCVRVCLAGFVVWVVIVGGGLWLWWKDK